MTLQEPTAYELSMHEAAHAVAAARFGHEFTSVTIEPDGDALGQVVVDTPQWVLDADVASDAAARRYLEEACIIALVGERMGAAARGDDGGSPRFADDEILAWMNLYLLHPDSEADANATMARLDDEAAALVADEDFRRATEATAAALREHGTVTWGDLIALVHGVG